MSTNVGGLPVNAPNIGGDTMLGDLSFSAGKRVVTDTGPATSTVHAATLNKQTGQITTESLTTAKDAVYTFTLTNSLIAATSTVLATVGKGSSTTGAPVVTWTTPGPGTVDILIINKDSTNALNGTITINFVVFN